MWDSRPRKSRYLIPPSQVIPRTSHEFISRTLRIHLLLINGDSIEITEAMQRSSLISSIPSFRCSFASPWNSQFPKRQLPPTSPLFFLLHVASRTIAEDAIRRGVTSPSSAEDLGWWYEISIFETWYIVLRFSSISCLISERGSCVFRGLTVGLGFVTEGSCLRVWRWSFACFSIDSLSTHSYFNSISRNPLFQSGSIIAIRYSKA